MKLFEIDLNKPYSGKTPKFQSNTKEFWKERNRWVYWFESLLRFVNAQYEFHPRDNNATFRCYASLSPNEEVSDIEIEGPRYLFDPMAPNKFEFYAEYVGLSKCIAFILAHGGKINTNTSKDFVVWLKEIFK